MHTALFLLLALVAGSNAMGHGAIHCLVGQASYTDDTILFDGLRERECTNPMETACWSSTMQISFQHNGTTETSTFVTAGCLIPEMEDQYESSLEEVQAFNNGSSFDTDSYEFNACNDTDYCNDVRPQGSMPTVECNAGVAVSSMGVQLFSFFQVEQCRVYDTCQSLEGTYMMNGQEMTFVWRGCGDPFKTIYDGQNVLPFLPSSSDPMMRVNDCVQYGCFEQVIGLCVCPYSLDISQFIQAVISFEDNECTGDLCNEVATDGGSGMPDMNYGDGMWCMTGERVSMHIPVEGMGDMWVNVEDNAAFVRCPSDYMNCVHYSVHGFTYDESVAARLDFGECLEMGEEANCDPYSTAEGTMSFINVTDCETKVCNESRCNDFGDSIEGQQVELPECRQHVPDPALGLFDIRVLPNCSVSEIFSGVEKCALQFGDQFPFYNQPDMCSMQLDAMVGCMTDLIHTCLSTNCPTILDSVPGLRSEFHVVRFFADQIKSVDDVIDTIFMLIPFNSEQEQQSIRSMIPDIKQFICMDPNQVSQEIGTILTDLINDQLLPMIGGSLNLKDIMGEELADAFFCDADLIEKVTSPVITLIPTLFGSQSEQDACNALVGFANNMIAQVGMSCNFGEVGTFVEYFIGQNSGFPMEIFSFIGMVAPMITQFKIPECSPDYNMDGCSSNPCGYQGSCVPTGPYDYYCMCMDGSYGQSCGGYGPTPAPGMNPCDSYPCGYDQQCVRTSDYGYYCSDNNEGGSGDYGPGDGDNNQMGEFYCEQYYHGTSACQMRKAWLCDYAQWRWTTLTVWLKEFHQFAQSHGHDMGHLEMPHCNHENAEMQCRNMEMRRCRYNEQMGCNECYCADHEYQNLEGLMDHWRHDYRAWSTFFQKYRMMMHSANGGMGGMDNDTC